MKHTEKDLKRSAVEDGLDKPIPQWCRTKSVSMTKAEDLSSDLDSARLRQALHTERLKI
jgi:hypothetical protein